MLYGGIDEETRKNVPFFDKTYDYINKKWNEINTHNCVYTDIYRRKIIYDNFEDLNKNKVFNYLIQSFETERNIQRILKLQSYLKNKKTKLILYGYDSFLFDFDKQDGVDILKNIKIILEKNNYPTKVKMGYTYNSVNDITNRL